jgi:hypothetical protein
MKYSLAQQYFYGVIAMLFGILVDGRSENERGSASTRHVGLVRVFFRFARMKLAVFFKQKGRK